MSIPPAAPAPVVVAPAAPPAPPAPPGIRAVGLRRFFGPVPAVVQVTFDAPAGAITGLIGPNGAGKTTLLLMLAGLLKPDAGQAFIAGYDLAAQPLQARAVIGWMPDAFGTWDALTCTEILTFFCRAYGLPREVARQRAQALLATVYLSEFAYAPARVLSRGQKQRLGLARALVNDPQVLLLDEPASGLDPRSRIELRDLLRTLAATGKTVLISSHILSELDEIVDHAVFLSAGQTVAVNTAQVTNVQRGWRLGALDLAGLTRFLDAKQVPWQPASGQTCEVIVTHGSFEAAADLMRDAAAAGVLLHTIAPVSGRLEEAYLSLNEERL